ncbi:uncharacterized protein BX664DRAFT_356751 [Halteromyces radiatus]|uniref:uncharacterized protein n=1 Tax=Halteromyces radiatus TaxID=101107 RepID=UPI00221FA8D3|nr:uncharacterized protein BX664DRAFT_356751 [Halteromyces radiatus]KAI8097520.1 hypothetical protein BX664DRAFT_356751 [Halteromyces radiatus]
MAKDELEKYLAYLPTRNPRPHSSPSPPTTANKPRIRIQQRNQQQQQQQFSRISSGLKGPRDLSTKSTTIDSPRRTGTPDSFGISSSSSSSIRSRKNDFLDNVDNDIIQGEGLLQMVNGLDLKEPIEDLSYSVASSEFPIQQDDNDDNKSNISTTEHSLYSATGKHQLEHTSDKHEIETIIDRSTTENTVEQDKQNLENDSIGPSSSVHTVGGSKTHSSSAQSNTYHQYQQIEDKPPIPTFSFGNISNDNDGMPPIPTFSFGNTDDDVNSDMNNNDKQDDVLNLALGLRCGGCDNLISGMAITAAGHRWHADCFKCQHCHQDLEHVAFYEKDGLPYCALDYHELFTTRCDYCHTPIEEKSITALGKHYHVGHFFCRECGKPFDEDGIFMEHDGHPYCEKDYLAKFSHKCKGCKEEITGDFLEALDGKWHLTCFVCVDCGRAFESNTFYVRNDLPYCEIHSRRIKKSP